MYSLRDVTDADYGFLFNLHRETMEAYIETTWGWEDNWQQEYFKAKWDPAKRQIIQVNNEDAGVLVIELRNGDYYLGLIEISKQFQGQGVGTAVIQDFLSTARQRNLSAALHVLKTNAKARQLYERLGFTIVAEEEHKYYMKAEMRR